MGAGAQGCRFASMGRKRAAQAVDDEGLSQEGASQEGSTQAPFTSDETEKLASDVCRYGAHTPASRRPARTEQDTNERHTAAQSCCVST